MIWILFSIGIFIMMVIVFFLIPFSKTKNNFLNDVQKHSEQPFKQSGVFTEQDIAFLPEPVQRHFRAAGFIGKPKMAKMTTYMKSVPLKESGNKPPMIVDYTLNLFAYKPIRLAYIKTSLFGIPFEGYDSLQDGVGFMKGVLGKVVTLFNQTGDEMDKAQLLTYLAECFLCPAIILNGYIKWESIDKDLVKATITYKNISGSGVFTFSDGGLFQSFSTDERAAVSPDGKTEYPKWSVVVEDYQNIKGINLPKKVKAIWHLNDGDLVYFDANNFEIIFDDVFANQ